MYCEVYILLNLGPSNHRSATDHSLHGFHTADHLLRANRVDKRFQTFYVSRNLYTCAPLNDVNKGSYRIAYATSFQFADVTCRAEILLGVIGPYVSNRRIRDVQSWKGTKLHFSAKKIWGSPNQWSITAGQKSVTVYTLVQTSPNAKLFSKVYFIIKCLLKISPNFKLITFSTLELYKSTFYLSRGSMLK